MTVISQPSTTVNITTTVQEVANTAQRVLFVGQKNGGSATGGALVENIQNDNSWDTLFGADSQISAMIRSARAINGDTRFDAISLADNGTTFAVYTITFTTGPAGEDGSYTITIGSETNNTVTVDVTSGDTVTTIAAAAVAAINADPTMPVTASNAAGVLTLTAVNAGTYGNRLGIQIDGTISAVTTPIAQTVTGATDPVLTSVLDVIGDEDRYQAIVWGYPSETQVVTVSDFLDDRFNVVNNVLDGVAFVGNAKTTATLLINEYDTLNSQSLLVVGDKTSSTTNVSLNIPSVFEIPDVKAAQFAAIRALRLTDGLSITQFLAGEAGLDSFGGPALASRPYFNTPFALLPVSPAGTGFTRSEVEDIFDGGISLQGNNKSGTSIIMGETVTTYKTDSADNPDVTFKFLNYVDTASNAREYFVNNLRARFAQSRLTEGDLVPGRPMANASLILSTLVEFYTTLSGDGFALTQAGEVARNTFINNTTITVDVSQGEVTILMASVPLVTQLRTFNATMAITFSTSG